MAISPCKLKPSLALSAFRTYQTRISEIAREAISSFTLQTSFASGRASTNFALIALKVALSALIAVRERSKSASDCKVLSRHPITLEPKSPAQVASVGRAGRSVRRVSQAMPHNLVRCRARHTQDQIGDLMSLLEGQRRAIEPFVCEGTLSIGQGY